MQGRRTDTSTRAKIIETKANNPDLSTREIEQDLGVPHETVAKVLREDFAQACTNSERVQQVIDSNNKIIALGKQMIEAYLPALEISKHSDLKVISDILDTSFKQNQLLTGNATERTEMSIEVLTDEQKRLIAKRYNS